jgi:hypothetical protein
LCPAATLTVHTAAELTKALGAAKGGDVIVVAPGTYRGEFSTRQQGTAASPIWLCGSGATLVGTGTSGGEVLSFNKAAHWNVLGLALTAGQTGLEVKASQGISVTGVTIYGIGDEGAIVRSASAGTRFADVVIHDVGLRKASAGYGVIVTASSGTILTHILATNAPAGAIRVDADAVGTVTS